MYEKLATSVNSASILKDCEEQVNENFKDEPVKTKNELMIISLLADISSKLSEISRSVYKAPNYSAEDLSRKV